MSGVKLEFTCLTDDTNSCKLLLLGRHAGADPGFLQLGFNSVNLKCLYTDQKHKSVNIKLEVHHFSLLKHTGQLKPLKSQTTEYSVLIFSNLLKKKNNNACNRYKTRGPK